MERSILQADEGRRYWRYRVVHAGQRYIQTVYAGGDGRLSSVLQRSQEERGGHELTVLSTLLRPGEREFGSVDEAVAAGESLIRRTWRWCY